MTSRRKARHLRKNARARRKKFGRRFMKWLLDPVPLPITYRDFQFNYLDILVPRIPMLKDKPPPGMVHGEPA